MFLLASNFCHETAKLWNLLGYAVTIIKIVIPLILIVLGMVDLGQAVVSSDDKAINKAVTTLLKRFVAAIIVFFVPTIVSAIFNALDIIDSKTQAEYNICVQCVTGGQISIDGYTSCTEYAKSRSY